MTHWNTVDEQKSGINIARFEKKNYTPDARLIYVAKMPMYTIIKETQRQHREQNRLQVVIIVYSSGSFLYLGLFFSPFFIDAKYQK